MSDHPVIFSGPMVRALLEDRKGMTRRLLYALREAKSGIIGANATVLLDHPPPISSRLGDYYSLTPWHQRKPGDRLWVRESLRDSQAGWTYAADKRLIEMAPKDQRVPAMISWAHHREQDYAPSIHMPRWASRLTLEITATKIESLQKITEADALREGVQHRWLKSAACAPRSHFFINAGDREYSGGSAVEAFEMLWSALHGHDSWARNPKVVAISFKVQQRNIDQ